LYLADLQKTYGNLMTNLGKILRSFENRAPEQFTSYRLSSSQDFHGHRCMTWSLTSDLWLRKLFSNPHSPVSQKSFQ